MDSVLWLIFGIVRGALLIVAAWWIGGWLRGVASRYLETRIDPSWRTILSQVVRFVPMLLVMQVVLEGVGLPSGSFLAVISTAGIAVALSLKDSLSNAASGAILLTTAPFRIGDTVTLAEKVTGTVQRIGFLTTIVDTDDGRRVTLTNDKILAFPIERHAIQGAARVEIVVRIPREDLTDALLAALLAAAASHEGLPAGTVTPTEFDDGHVRVVVRAWARADGAIGARAALFVTLNAILPHPPR